VAWKSGLRRWVSVAATVSLAVTAAAVIVALAAAVGARAGSRELSQRLVPGAAAAGVLLAQYTLQQTSLRDYVTSGRLASLAPFQQAAVQIPGQEKSVGGLVARYPVMPGQVAAALAAYQRWLAKVAGPQLRRRRTVTSAARGRCKPTSR
jgi:CHASE3 domain